MIFIFTIRTISDIKNIISDISHVKMREHFSKISTNSYDINKINYKLNDFKINF